MRKTETDNTMCTIGERVKRIRRASNKKLTQAQFGKIVGLSQAAVARLENGRLKRIEMNTVLLIANTFGVSVDYLLGREVSTMPAKESQVSDKGRRYADVLEEIRRMNDEDRAFIEGIIVGLKNRRAAVPPAPSREGM
jgi:transcriptional regulator with XRE-family HTH domain